MAQVNVTFCTLPYRSAVIICCVASKSILEDGNVREVSHCVTMPGIKDERSISQPKQTTRLVSVIEVVLDLQIDRSHFGALQRIGAEAFELPFLRGTRFSYYFKNLFTL